MGFVNSMFSNNNAVNAVFYGRTEPAKNADGTRGAPTYGAILTVDALFWEGSAADTVVSDRIRADVSAVIALDYYDYTVDVADVDKVTIEGIDYSVIHVDNVARQNKVIQIALKRYS